MGAGVVEIDGLGFIKTHTFQTCHVKADGHLSEIFAFDCALQIIQEKGHAERHFEVYSDNQMVHKIFTEGSAIPKKNDIYIENLRKQLQLVKKFTKFELRYPDMGTEQFAKMAHLLSREYMENSLTAKIIAQSQAKK